MGHLPVPENPSYPLAASGTVVGLRVFSMTTLVYRTKAFVQAKHACYTLDLHLRALIAEEPSHSTTQRNPAPTLSRWSSPQNNAHPAKHVSKTYHCTLMATCASDCLAAMPRTLHATRFAILVCSRLFPSSLASIRNKSTCCRPRRVRVFVAEDYQRSFGCCDNF